MGDYKQEPVHELVAIFCSSLFMVIVFFAAMTCLWWVVQ